MHFDNPADDNEPAEPTKLSWASMVRTARAPIGFSLIAVLAMLFLPQMRDMLRTADYGAMSGAGWAFHPALFLFALSGWYWSRTLLAARFRFPDDQPPSGGGGTDGRGRGPQISVKELPVDPDAFALVPRLLFVAIAAGGFGAALKSGAYIDAVVVFAWAALACRFLVFRRKDGIARKDGTSGPTPAVAAQ